MQHREFFVKRHRIEQLLDIGGPGSKTEQQQNKT
jgi:hypothetical protein